MRINQLKAGVILSYLSMGLGTAISLLYTPIMLKLLGQNEYGLYTLVSSVVSYLGLLSFGFGSAYIRYYSIYKAEQDEEKIARLNGMFMTIFCVIGAIAMVAGFVLSENTQYIFKDGLTPEEIQKTRILMQILVVNISISFPASVFSSYITANEKFVFLKLAHMVKTVAGPLVMLPVLLLGYKSVGMVVVTTAINLIVEGICAVFCLRNLKMKFNFRHFQFGLLKELWVFSFYIFLNIVTDQINWNVDKFLLGIFKGSASVAVYGIAAQLNNYYLSFSTAVSSVFIPKVNAMVAGAQDDWELTSLFTRVGRIQFIILGMIIGGYVIFGRYFISVWAGNGFEMAYFAGLFLIIPALVPSIQNIGIEIQRAKNMHKFRSIVYTLIAVGNIANSIPLCKHFGSVGAAMGTAIVLILGNGIIMNIYYHKKIGLDMIYFWKNIGKFVPALLAPSLFGFLVMRFYPINSMLRFLGSAVVYVVIYCLSMWFLGMNGYEKALITKPLKKLKRSG